MLRRIIVVCILALVITALPLGALRRAGADPLTDGTGLATGLGTGDPTGSVSADGAWGLVGSSYTVANVDPTTGDLMANSVRESSGSDASIVTDMSSNGLLALDAEQLAAKARQEALQARAAAQTTIGPDGCPSSAPAGTLRSGADAIGIAKLCADSVAQARTPVAARAIKFALAQLGKPYSQPLRNDANHFDCSSLVSRSYQAAGVNAAPPGQNAPVTRDGSNNLLRRPWTIPETATDARPGDFIFYPGSDPPDGHVAMLLADGFMVQAPHTGDVVDVSSAGTGSDYRWVDPTKF